MKDRPEKEVQVRSERPAQLRVLTSTHYPIATCCSTHILKYIFNMHRASVGKPAPDFTATAVMDGKLKGKLVLN